MNVKTRFHWNLSDTVDYKISYMQTWCFELGRAQDNGSKWVQNGKGSSSGQHKHAQHISWRVKWRYWCVGKRSEGQKQDSFTGEPGHPQQVYWNVTFSFWQQQPGLLWLMSTSEGLLSEKTSFILGRGRRLCYLSSQGHEDQPTWWQDFNV